MDTADLQIHEIIKDLNESIHDLWTTDDIVTFLKGYLTDSRLGKT